MDIEFNKMTFAVDRLSIKLFGMTKREAQRQGICVSCHEPWQNHTRSAAGHKEYQISGLCEKCFDEIAADRSGEVPDED